MSRNRKLIAILAMTVLVAVRCGVIYTVATLVVARRNGGHTAIQHSLACYSLSIV